MHIQITIDDEIAHSAQGKVQAVGITLEQALTVYLTRVAEGTEPIANEFAPDGTFKLRTYRQQIYR